MNPSRLQAIFQKTLQIPPEAIHDDLQYNSIKEWDSVGHMALIAEIESQFDIMLDTDDILAMNSFAKAKEILKKYGIECDA
jgi:acyl carrier protein